MRVIAGSAGSLRLKTLDGMDTRPTTDRIKETLFNMIGPSMFDCVFLDLFAGSGGIGIEALSRGAMGAVFVEKNPKAMSCIRDNLKTTNLMKKAITMSDNNMPEPEINLNEVREMPQGQTVTEQQSSMMREIPQGQTGMETQNRLMRETMDRNGDDSQKSAVERLAENIFSEAEISNMENDVREDESNFENRFPSPIIPDFIRQSSPRQENKPVTVTEPGISSRTTGRTANPVNSEHGFLKVEVRTGENGIPVSGAAVSVTKKNGKEEDIMFTGITDESGSVPIIELPAPPMGTGNTPESFEHYETYMVSAYSNGFYREVSENVPVFSGITSIQRFNLIPEPFNYDDMGRSIVNENTEPNF